MKKIIGMALVLMACDPSSKQDFLGSAVLDAPVYRVGAELGGRVLWVRADEGSMVHRGDTLALLDTVALDLQIREAQSQIREFQAGLQAKTAEFEPLDASLQSLQRESRRARELVQAQVLATQKSDEISDQILLLQSRKSVTRQGLLAYKAKYEVMQSALARLVDQKRRLWIVAPVDGMVQTQFVRPGEVIKPAQVLAEIQKTDSLDASFFAPQALLSSLKIGQKVKIRIETAEGAFQMQDAQIRQIASEAQFTPKGSQTRENRSELVFEVKLKMANPQGNLHPGLPVEVWR